MGGTIPTKWCLLGMPIVSGCVWKNHLGHVFVNIYKYVSHFKITQYFILHITPLVKRVFPSLLLDDRPRDLVSFKYSQTSIITTLVDTNEQTTLGFKNIAFLHQRKTKESFIQVYLINTLCVLHHAYKLIILQG